MVKLNAVNVVKENVAKKSFFKVLGEKLGFVQKEVQACKGKTLNEVAEMATKKEQLQFSLYSKKRRLENWEIESKALGEELSKTRKQIYEAKQVLQKVKDKDPSSFADVTAYNGKYHVSSSDGYYKKQDKIANLVSDIEQLEKKYVAQEQDLLARANYAKDLEAQIASLEKELSL